MHRKNGMYKTGKVTERSEYNIHVMTRDGSTVRPEGERMEYSRLIGRRRDKIEPERCWDRRGTGQHECESETDHTGESGLRVWEGVSAHKVT